MGLDDAQQDSQDGTEDLRLALQVPAQPFGHRENPLPMGRWRGYRLW
jgi:hypothetical protein